MSQGTHAAWTVGEGSVGSGGQGCVCVCVLGREWVKATLSLYACIFHFIEGL